MEKYYILLDELRLEMECYIDYLEYKYTYPQSAFGIYDTKTEMHIYQDDGFMMSYSKWKQLFLNS